MAIRAAMVATKTLLAEEGENVIGTAVRMIRTVTEDSSGMVSETLGMRTETVVGDTLGTSSGPGGSLGKISEMPSAIPKEFGFGAGPKEAELGIRGPPEVNPGRFSGNKKEVDLSNPQEIRFPDPKSNAEVKPAEVAEKEAKAEMVEDKVAEDIAHNVPTDPTSLTVPEQGRRQNKPEVGQAGGFTEVGREEKRQESTEDGAKQIEVGKREDGPEVGRDRLSEMM